MRILVISVGVVSSGGAGQAALGQLVAAGCYGEMEEPATPESLQEALIMESVRRLGERALVLDEIEDFFEIEAGWGYMRLTVADAEEAIQVLEALEDDTVLLVLADAPGGRGAFILVAPGSPIPGEAVGASWSDLGPTLLVVTGRDVPAGMKGSPLLASAGHESAAPVLSEDEQSLLRERLKGLGYIG